MFIEIESYGDYDVPQTECLLESPNEDSDIKALLKEFSEEYISDKDKLSHFSVNKDEITGVREDETSTKLFIEFLIKTGFKTVKPKKIRIAD